MCEDVVILLLNSLNLSILQIHFLIPMVIAPELWDATNQEPNWEETHLQCTGAELLHEGNIDVAST